MTEYALIEFMDDNALEVVHTPDIEFEKNLPVHTCQLGRSSTKDNFGFTTLGSIHVKQASQ